MAVYAGIISGIIFGFCLNIMPWHKSRRVLGDGHGGTCTPKNFQSG